MPKANEFWKVAAQVVSERGGLVVGFPRDSAQPELGSTLGNVLGFAPESPVRVTSLSDWADWIEQVEAFYRLRPDWGRGKRGTADTNYYRVKFEETPETLFALKSDGRPDLATPTSSTSSSAFDSSYRFSAPAVPSFAGYAEPLTGLQGVSFGPRLAARVIDLLRLGE